jgi:hypothetical protein
MKHNKLLALLIVIILCLNFIPVITWHAGLARRCPILNKWPENLFYRMHSRPRVLLIYDNGTYRMLYTTADFDLLDMDDH